jgi:hypothetical protein
LTPPRFHPPFRLEGQEHLLEQVVLGLAFQQARAKFAQH